MTFKMGDEVIWLHPFRRQDTSVTNSRLSATIEETPAYSLNPEAGSKKCWQELTFNPTTRVSGFPT
jgi:hypothetical protein